VTIALLASGVLTPLAHADDGATPKAIARRALPAVVTIETFDVAGNPLSQGSGFIASADGLVVTNFHVVEHAIAAQVILQNQERYAVVGVAAFDVTKDFAVLKVQAVELPQLRMGNSDRVEPGDAVVALGAPRGLPGSITAGIFSQRRLDKAFHWLQHSAAISPGSSGGPLLLESGDVVGINTMVMNEANSLSFALPINHVRAAINESTGALQSLGTIERSLVEQRDKDAHDQRERTVSERFIVYRDPEHLFTVMLPRAWHVQRNTWTDRDGAYHVVVMSHAATVEVASVYGAVSEGIRLHVVFPPKGRAWKQNDSVGWLTDNERAVTARYPHHQVVARQTLALAGTQGSRLELELPIVARRGQPSQRALAFQLFHTRGRATVDLALPTWQSDDLELLDQVFERSLVFDWIN
jgi:hypothetical protein